jgi:perosamine synthetase
VPDGRPLIRLSHPVPEEDERQAVLDALASGQLAQGPRVAAFEQAFAEYVGVRHAVALSSGTAALHLALLAHGVGPGDEVIVPAFSFAATANVVLHAGARPAFADVREDDFGIDVDAVGSAIAPRTRAVIGVHLYGQTCDVIPLAALCRERGIMLIEDAAQAHGAEIDGRRTGSFATAAFSFYATKNLQTGEGGMLTTDEDAIAERARLLRSQGERERYVTEEAGFNYRMTEFAAALGHAGLRRLDERNERRRAHARALTAGLERVRTPAELPERRHVFHQYTVRVPGGREARDRLRTALLADGVESAVFYPRPIHRQPLYERLGYGDIDLPIAQRLADEVLSLPVHPGLSDADIDTIVRAVNDLSR